MKKITGNEENRIKTPTTFQEQIEILESQGYQVPSQTKVQAEQKKQTRSLTGRKYLHGIFVYRYWVYILLAFGLVFFYVEK